MTLGEWLSFATQSIPKLEAQVIAAHLFGRDRSWVIAHPEVEVDAERFDPLLSRRTAGEPLPYILGFREFYGRRFLVDPRVLIPRQETEILVEMFLQTVEALPGLRVADIGTGSGCIAITAALERPELEVFGIDLSSVALEVARQNGVDVPVRFVCADGVEWLQENPVDVILTNPPYVGFSDEIGPGVKEHEPHVALFAGESGLTFYEKLAACPWTGDLFCEIGMGQGDSIRALFASDEFVSSRNDLAGIERVLHFRRRGIPRA
ncbi:MAG: peptide chain release factor N(5)-glutamine methyltransferase [Fimbriimonadaceae bacterium]